MAAFGQAAPPDWFDGSSVDEIAFSEYVLCKHPMRCIHDRLYDIDGLLSDAAVQSEILEYVRPYVKSNVAKNVEKYLNALKLAAYCQELPIQEDRIHFQNGTYFIEDRRFTPEKEFCLNRLPVRYNPEAPEPVRWKKFLDELLYPEDIPTLQEFMGYTLLPSNKGQKMMIIIGNGGEGKSRIGRVLRAILGCSRSSTAGRRSCRESPVPSITSSTGCFIARTAASPCRRGMKKLEERIRTDSQKKNGSPSTRPIISARRTTASAARFAPATRLRPGLFIILFLRTSRSWRRRPSGMRMPFTSGLRKSWRTGIKRTHLRCIGN